MPSLPPRFSLFYGSSRICAGDLAEVALAAWRATQIDSQVMLLAFNLDTGEVADLDLRGTEREVAERYSSPSWVEGKRGRPKLGIVSREVTLLPRHWDWLGRQPGGASSTLRRLVELASKDDASGFSPRIDPSYRFMSAIAGDFPNFEEASRALFAGDQSRLREIISSWPGDIYRQIMEILNGGIHDEK